jgi:rubrerythrin
MARRVAHLAPVESPEQENVVSSRHRPSYVALVAALRAEFSALQLEAMKIQLRGYRYYLGSMNALFQAVHDAQDVAYDTSEWACPECGYHNKGPVCTHCGQPLAVAS